MKIPWASSPVGSLCQPLNLATSLSIHFSNFFLFHNYLYALHCVCYINRLAYKTMFFRRLFFSQRLVSPRSPLRCALHIHTAEWLHKTLPVSAPPRTHQPPLPRRRPRTSNPSVPGRSTLATSAGAHRRRYAHPDPCPVESNITDARVDRCSAMATSRSAGAAISMVHSVPIRHIKAVVNVHAPASQTTPAVQRLSRMSSFSRTVSSELYFAYFKLRYHQRLWVC